MNFIFDRAVANELGEKYLVLELETLPAGDKLLECFCVVPSESMPIDELPQLEHYRGLHQSLIHNLKQNNVAFCVEMAGMLKGKFGGELDSFYEHVVDRFKDQ